MALLAVMTFICTTLPISVFEGGRYLVEVFGFMAYKPTCTARLKWVEYSEARKAFDDANEFYLLEVKVTTR